MRKPNQIICLSILVVILCGCHNTPANPPVLPEQKVAQYNQIVATANLGMANVVANLAASGVISKEHASAIAQYQVSVATATKGIALILEQPGAWPDKALQIQHLALTLVPPKGYQAWGVQTDAQWASFVLAMDSLSSTIRIIVQLSTGAA